MTDLIDDKCHKCEEQKWDVFPWIMNFPQKLSHEDLEYFSLNLPKTIMGVLSSYFLGEPSSLNDLTDEYSSWFSTHPKAKSHKEWEFDHEEFNGPNHLIYLALLCEAFSDQCKSLSTVKQSEKEPLSYIILHDKLDHISNQLDYYFRRWKMTLESDKMGYTPPTGYFLEENSFLSFKEELYELFSFPLESLLRQLCLACSSLIHFHYKKTYRKEQGDVHIEGWTRPLIILRWVLIQNIGSFAKNYSSEELFYFIFSLMPKTNKYLCRFLENMDLKCMHVIGAT